MICRCSLTADGATVPSTTATTKKKKDDKETAKAAVRARYLMEKYGAKWRCRVASGKVLAFLNVLLLLTFTPIFSFDQDQCS